MPSTLKLAHVRLLWALPVLAVMGTAESSSNVTRPCSVSCVRVPTMENYGFDSNKDQVLVDIGRCEEVYSDPHAGCEINPHSCNRECSPRSHWMQPFTNRSGPFTVKVIKSCYATTHHCQTCQRKPNKVYMFPGSKYQVQIDVGKCSGTCTNTSSGSGGGEEEGEGEVMGCQPTRVWKEAVEGPNGFVSIDVIQNCSCVRDVCYRADHFQSVSVLVNGQRQEERVNVGKCVGTCAGVWLPPRCLYPLDGTCLFHQPGGPARCRPTEGSSYSYTSLDGSNRTLAVVEECGCISA